MSISLETISNPNHLQQHEASSVLINGFISEFQKYLIPKDIDPVLTSWWDGKNSVANYYQKCFETEFNDFLAGKIDYWIEARVAGKLAGWATFQQEKNQPKAYYMNILVVDPRYQKMSIGTNLVMSLLHLNIVPDLKTIHLLLRVKNHGGRIFYTKLGFASDPKYRREDVYVPMELLEPLTWMNL